ncbi:MAG: (2Fe-2S)-binding protein [Candidatus Competibacteraceae bacterium]
MTPEAIGGALQAGTNCGSCVPELRQLIAQRLESTAPETTEERSPRCLVSRLAWKY